jgi:tryptophan halogenase
MKYGWMFRIPVWGRKGNGYIFDSNYINADEAQREVEQMLGEGIDVRKEISFDPGAVKNPWIKNCVAIGLSASFVEPLEATSIGTSIQQSFLLTDRILNYNEVTVNKYNKEVTSILNDIRDFIALHYITDRDDSDFWKDQKNVPLPPNLEENLTQWKNRLPTTGDFDSTSDYKLFDKMHYILVMHGLGLFNIEKIKEQYEMLPQSQKELAQRVVNDSEYSRSNYRTIPHKEIIRLVRLLNG